MGKVLRSHLVTKTSWELQKEKKNLQLGTQLYRKSKYERTCMLPIYTFSARVDGDWLAEVVRRHSAGKSVLGCRLHTAV